MKSRIWFIGLTLILLASCTASPTPPITAPLSTNTPQANIPTLDSGSSHAFTEEETATLNSLKQVDDYPLYTMQFIGSYSYHASLSGIPDWPKIVDVSKQESCQVNWGCSLFAALGDESDRLYGRNFDWQFSPALLLFTDPPDGYASVSMVDIEYLDFGGKRSQNLTGLPLADRRALLDAPSLPFDGMNEKGLVVGMAAIPEQDMPYDPQKKTLDELEVIREILDHAGTVDEAIAILGNYNIDMGSVPIHYLVASTAGESALVEFYQGKMIVFRNETPWQVTTNFLVASTNGDTQGQCWRYDRVDERLKQLGGQISSKDALHLLEDVSQENTQWSIVYHMTSGDMEVVMGRNYLGTIHTFHLRE